MSKISRWWVIGLVVVILTLPGVLSLVVREVPRGFQPSSDATIKVFGSRTVSQLVKPANYFSGVAVSIKNPNLENKDDLIVEIKQGDELLRKVVLTGRGIEDGNYVKIRFPAITGSVGQQYSINFSAPDATDDKALSLVTTNFKSSELGEMKIASQSAEQGVALVTLSRPSNPLMVSAFVYQNLLSRLLADWGFAIVYGLIIAIVVGLLIRRQP